MIMTLRGYAAKMVVALAVVCLCASTFDWAGAATLQGKTVTPTPRLSSPRVGDTLIAGERVFIRWTVETQGINVPFCEQEIFLILDNGAGCDQRPFAFYEGLFPQTRHVFQILPPRESSGAITLKSLKDVEARAGDEIEISWESSVDQVDSFEIRVSYDRGLHFHSIGKTSEQRFTWTVPEDISGVASFKVVARKTDGTRVESWGAAESQLKVRDK
jgi:hypothetical protein